MAAVADWITVNDFSPGIHSDAHGFGSATAAALPRNGAAVETDTYRCYADKSGALVPLPGKSTRSIAVPFMDFAGNADGYPAQIPRAMLLDALVMGPVIEQRNSSPTGLDTNTVFLLYAVIYDPTVSGVAANLRQYVVGKALGPNSTALTPFDFVFSKGNTGAMPVQPTWPSGSLDRSRCSVTPGTVTPDLYRPTVIGSTCFDRATTAAGQVVGAMSAAEQGLTNFDTVTWINTLPPSINFWGEGVWQTPKGNFAVPTSSIGKIAGPTSVNAPLIVGHQGRAVYARRTPTPFYGTATNVGWFLSDFITYTDAGDFASGNEDAIYSEENPSPIGVMLSMSANELFIVKHQGGGVLVRGDIANPQVVRLPLIHSTGGYTMRAAHTPYGVFYGTPEGVVRWDGGDSTELVSKQLNNLAFWLPQAGTDLMEGMRARFSYWHPWVLVPNDWLFDTEGGGWWRLEQFNPLTEFAHSHYDVGANGIMYAFRHRLMGVGVQPAIDGYPRGLGAASWSWKSQPLIESREREDNYAEIEIVAQKGASSAGAATIVATLTGYRADGTAVTASATFALAANINPQVMIKAITPNFTARFVQLRLAVSDDGGGNAAPKVISVRLGRGPRARVPRT